MTNSQAFDKMRFEKSEVEIQLKDEDLICGCGHCLNRRDQKMSSFNKILNADNQENNAYREDKE